VSVSGVVIRRTWAGFGECRITIAPRSTPPRRWLSARLSAAPSRLLSRIGLAAIRFTIDPKLLEGDQQSAGPMASRFLQVHREALAKEWRARQELAEKRTPAARPSPDTLRLIALTAEDVSRRRRWLALAIVVALLIIGIAVRVAYKYSTDPMNARLSFDNGQRELQVSQYAQAIPAFDRAIQLEPKFAEAYLFRGKALAASGERERAILDFSEAIELQPSNPNPVLERGSAYFYIKNYPAAIADATRAIELNPMLATAYNLRAIALREMGDSRKALEDLDRAVQLDPSQDNYFQRASTNQLVGDHRKAIDDLNRVLEFEPGDVPAYYARARSRRAIGDTEGATQDTQHARELENR
jgi:tetratricopeptide (TPR) repeat protein